MDINSVERYISITPPDSPLAEEHLSTDCKYIRFAIQLDDGRTCFVWLRKCVCGRKVDMTHMVLTGKMAIINQDGVDFHFSDVCEWEERSFSGGNVLKRACFEESHILSLQQFGVNHVAHAHD